MNNMQTINTQEIRRCDKLSVEPTIYRSGGTKPEFIYENYNQQENCNQQKEVKIKPILLNKNSLDPYSVVPNEKGDLMLRDYSGNLATIPFNKIAEIVVDKSVPNEWRFKIFLKNGFEMSFNASKNPPNKGEWEVGRATRRKFHLIRHDLCLVN